MPQSSTYFSILTAVQSVIQTLNLLDWNGNTVPSLVRKDAEFRQQVEANNPPFIYVARYKQERVEPKVFGDTVWVWYPVAINTVAAGNRDLNQHLDFYLSWRQKLRQSFQSPTLSGVTAVFDSNIYPDTLLDAAWIQKNYDVNLLRVEFKADETRGLT